MGAREPINLKVVRSDAQEYEQVVACELLIPDIPNSYGDIYTREAIKEFVYAYAMHDYFIDVNHDQVDVRDQKAIVVESFIARPGDPDFIEGSWVVFMKILDADLWQKILDGEINGYSYEAGVLMTEVVIQNLRNRQVVGTTEPDPVDGHTHTYLVLLNALNKPISGATGETAGHAHTISRHTVTDKAASLTGWEHSHRYQVITSDEGA
jgi:hypothetical protein